MVDEPTIETGTVVDVEGNEYVTVKIGDQWWMAENLRSRTFRSGNPIPNIQDTELWGEAEGPGYCSYQNTSPSTEFLYNFFVVVSEEQIAPEGWHIPSDDEWKQLEEFIGMPVSELDKTNWRGTSEGDALKSESSRDFPGWLEYGDVWGTDTYGFSANGQSCRLFDGKWGVPGKRLSGFWWSSTSKDGYAWYRYLDYKKSGIFRYCGEHTYGFSIRCVKD